MFREAVGATSRHHRDGHQVLLADYAEVLRKVARHTEFCAEVFNDTFPGGGKQERIDPLNPLSVCAAT